MSTLRVVVGAQYGSEAKGAVAGFLTRKYGGTVVRVAGPNAGHTAYDDQGRKWALRQVPVGMVTNPQARGVIAAGSEIDLSVLAQEIRDLDKAGHKVSERLQVSPEATVIIDAHKTVESQLVGKIGSTGKGVGAARADRLMRRALRLRDYFDLNSGNRQRYVELSPVELDTVWSVGGDILAPWDHYLNQGDVLIEGTQGYGLGIHEGLYPQCTSSDCTAVDFLSMARISPWHWLVENLEVWLVARAFPIRVAGNSGPLYKETSWAALDLPEELTTVTQKVRRVGHWDPILMEQAMRANGWSQGDPWNRIKVAYTMADQEFRYLQGVTAENLASVPEDDWRQAFKLIQSRTHRQTALIGTSPKTMIDLEEVRG